MSAWREERIGGQRLILGNCHDVIRDIGRFDAVVTDPPYGIGYSHGGGGGKLARSTKFAKMRIIGDDAPFDPSPWIGQPAILWGANHYADRLPASQSWLIWDKRCANYSNDQADGEMAWSNLGMPARIFRHVWNGMLRGPESRTPRVHPTQKPIALMQWCIGFVGGVVLDPFMGSGTTLVACEIDGRQGIGVEIDPGHFETACRRVAEASAKAAGVTPDSGRQIAMKFGDE